MTVLRAIRLVLFGFGGCIVWFASMIGLIVSFVGEKTTVGPLVLSVAFILGALAILYGTGEWGRWAYLLVFFSIPASLILFALIPSPLLHSFTLLAILVPGFCAYFTYYRVRSYYARKLAKSETPEDSTAA